MNTLKQRAQATGGNVATPEAMRALIDAHGLDNVIINAALRAKAYHCLSDLDAMTIIAFHAIIAAEEVQAAMLQSLLGNPAQVSVGLEDGKPVFVQFVPPTK